MPRTLIFARVLSLLLLVSTLGSFAPTHATTSLLGGQKLLLDARDTAALTTLQASGATLLAEYGSFSLWRTATGPATVAAHSLASAPTDIDLIYLRNGTINTATNSTPRLEPALSTLASTGQQLWLLQFVGPVQDAWLEQVRAAGLQIVQYQPNNAYIVWGEQAQLTVLANAHGFVQWTGSYQPDYRLEPALKPLARAAVANQRVSVVLQIYDHGGAHTTLQQLQSEATQQLMAATSAGGLVTLALELPASQLASVAALPDVVNVERWQLPTRQDERQAQIIAGNLSGTQPAGPGYLAWLATKGFVADPTRYPIVDVVDDGIDNGDAANPNHPDFYQQGVKPGISRLAYLQNCTVEPGVGGTDGHGNLNAGILGGYNNTAGAAYNDDAGYSYGLGVAPFGRIAGSKVFQDGGLFDFFNCGNSYNGLVAASYAAGAAITSDSWGFNQSRGAYNATSRLYDLLTRDASAETPGNQEMLHVIAAGNDGPGIQTVQAPSSAKNVLTVGASENVRDEDIADGCNLRAANSADDIASYSGRGPTADGRSKPDLVAPGTHIQGPATQIATFNASGICGANSSVGDKRFYPAEQTLYTWSSGTSHATPAVAGAAALAYEYYGRVLAPGATPSPAMLKALLVSSARHMNGVGSGDTLPSNNQGWGSVNLGTLFDDTPRLLLDQQVLLGDSGQLHELNVAVADGSRPLDITLAWTDAAGSSTGAAYVNDLNLEVTIGGVVYRGNVFTGAFSSSSGEFDSRNNLERVRLPAGATGNISIRVTGANIAGDGVPGNADSTDQDFALVVTNALKTPQTISFAPIAEQPAPGSSFALDVSASSGLPVSLSATGPCSINGYEVRLTGAGSCAITATQPGNDSYTPAEPITRTFIIRQVYRVLLPIIAP